MMKMISLYIVLAVAVSFLMHHRMIAQELMSTQQRLEQIVEASEAMHGGTQSFDRTQTLGYGGKCGLWLSFEVARNWNSFTEAQKQRVQRSMAAPATQKDRIIGHFHIYYDSSGVNTPSMITIDSLDICRPAPGTVEAFVDSVGAFFNYAWTYEIDSLGYAPPPLEIDGYYRINIRDEGPRLYGETIHDTNPINSGIPYRYKTYITIDNDFCEVFSRGIPALKVTAAHEFHHAIQIGAYGEWTNDFYFYEITSTWMEDVVYDEINDYYQYLKIDRAQPNPPTPLGQFANPDISFTSFNGLLPYSRAIWGKFIEKRFSRDVIRHTWEYMQNSSSVPSLDLALSDAGSSFRRAFVEWAYWNYRTYTNSDTVRYYTEGKQYPAIQSRNVIEYNHTPRSFADSIPAVSSVYHPICILASPSDLCGNSPTMMSIISNINTGASQGFGSFGFMYDLTDSGDASYKKLANGIYVRLTVPDPPNWISQESDSLFAIQSVVSEVVICPNPFYPRRQSYIYFRLPGATEQSATISIFGSSMDQIVAKELPLKTTSCRQGAELDGGTGIQWDGLDNYQSLVPSGIYFYVIDVGDKQYMGKFSVIKE